MSGALLLDERQVAAQPSLIRAFGLLNAVVLQQIHWHHVYGDGTERDGEEWFPITYAGLADETGLTADQVRRAVERLEADGLLISCQPEGRSSRRKWYRVDAERVRSHGPEVANLPHRKRRNRQMGSGESAASSTSQPEPESEPTEREEKVSARRPRPRFVEFDALVEVWGQPGTREEAAFFASVARSLKDQGKTAVEIVDRGKRARTLHSSCTPKVLLTRWSSLAPPNRGAGKWDSIAEADREAARRVAGQ